MKITSSKIRQIIKEELLREAEKSFDNNADLAARQDAWAHGIETDVKAMANDAGIENDVRDIEITDTMEQTPDGPAVLVYVKNVNPAAMASQWNANKNLTKNVVAVDGSSSSELILWVKPPA